jgi:3',5'-cyclic AMP phosphodiesterase CpdA
MGFIQENKIVIDLGTDKEYVLLQFNDVHAVSYDEKNDEKARDKAITQESLWMKQRVDFAKKFQEKYDSENLLSSKDCLNRLIEYANEIKPDLVLMVGDLVDYYSNANHDFLKESINKLNIPYLFACGNHESPSEKFQDICQGDCDINYVDFCEFIVVAINNSPRRIKQSQLNVLNNLLEYRKPIILVMHIPIMTEYNQDIFAKLDSYYSMKYDEDDTVTNKFIDLVSTTQEIKAILCGHIHGSILTMIAPDKPQYCCSSGLIGQVNKIIIR